MITVAELERAVVGVITDGKALRQTACRDIERHPDQAGVLCILP
jgi:hypothetical protein